ncbi:hypothetical protein [Demequina sp. NBRC 110056]|nr:hypothetical protein [Demequina sp. NBRC 110056]
MAKLPFNRDWRLRKTTNLFDEVGGTAEPAEFATSPHDVTRGVAAHYYY